MEYLGGKKQIADEIREKTKELNALLTKAKENSIVVEFICNSNAFSETKNVIETEIYEKNEL